MVQTSEATPLGVVSGSSGRNTPLRSAPIYRASILIAAILISLLTAACTPNSPSEAGERTDTAVSTTIVPVAELEPTQSGSVIPGTEPIYGYGDYSAYAYADVPWDVVTAATITCLRDQGWPVVAIGKTGIPYAAVPPDQNQAVIADETRCFEGLNLPEYAEPSALDIAGVYSFWVDVLKPCYEDEGYDIPDPPSLESFVESYPAVEWVPWRFIPEGSLGLEEQCSSDPYDYDL